MDNLNNIEFDGANDKTKEILEAIDQIPFGNSAFMISQLVVHHEIDSRNYKQVLLEIWEKFRALKEAQFRRRRQEVKRKRIEKKIHDNTDELEREELNIDLEEIAHNIVIEDKLIKDALVELNVYYARFKTLPKLTREQFEAYEPQFHLLKAVQAGQRELLTTGMISTGTAEYMQKLGLNPYKAALELKEHAIFEEANAKQLIAKDIEAREEAAKQLQP